METAHAKFITLTGLFRCSPKVKKVARQLYDMLEQATIFKNPAHEHVLGVCFLQASRSAQEPVGLYQIFEGTGILKEEIFRNHEMLVRYIKAQPVHSFDVFEGPTEIIAARHIRLHYAEKLQLSDD
ncbi:hypothetical protein FRB95_012501, partial [Tulasnella sp. JGI-2019a]